MTEEFYITLVSNVAPEIYPNNTPNHFFTPLNHPLFFDKPGWTVALKEITFQNSIQTILNESIELWHGPGKEFELVERLHKKKNVFTSNYLDIQSAGGEMRFDLHDYPFIREFNYNDTIFVEIIREGEVVKRHDFENGDQFNVYFDVATTDQIALYAKRLPYVIRREDVPKGYYENVESFLSTLNKLLPPTPVEFTVSGSGESKRIKVNGLPENHYLELKNGLHYVLGFKDTVIKSTPYSGVYRPDLVRGAFAMFIYCDVIEHVMVGNTLAPLLRTNHLQSASNGETLSYTFNPAYYMKLNKTFVSELEIDIRTDSGEPFPLHPSSKLILTLHFLRDKEQETSSC